MARAKSEFLKAFGTAFEIFKAISDAVRAKDGSDDDLRRLISDSSLAEQVAGVIIGSEFDIAKLLPVPVESFDETDIDSNVKEAWCKLANELDYKGPILWQVPAGFTLKQHAPKAGPCYEDFQYLQDWKFADKPTAKSLVFWIPRVVEGSTNKTYAEQIIHLSDLRKSLKLSEHHLSSLGSVSLNAALILAHFKRTGEKVPLDQCWVRTDIRNGDEHRLSFGSFDENGLFCNDFWDYERDSDLGVFPLGVETLGN